MLAPLERNAQQNIYQIFMLRYYLISFISNNLKNLKPEPFYVLVPTSLVVEKRTCSNNEPNPALLKACLRDTRLEPFTVKVTG